MSDSVYKLSCSNDQCMWETLPQNLTVPRAEFVGIPVPDDFIHCSGEQKFELLFQSKSWVILIFLLQ